MKIWAQTAGVVGSSHGHSPPYQRSLNGHFQEVARPGTIVDLYGVKDELPAPDRCRSSQHLKASWVIANAVQAEREGYDAFAVVNTMDPGFYEVRELVDIPVAFIMESSMHLACLLAANFAFVTHTRPMLLRLTEMAKRYGLAQRMTPGGSLTLRYGMLPDMFKNPGPYVSAFIEKAREVIDQGADILLLAGNPFNMFIVAQGIKEVDGVPILDVCAAVIKTAEHMVDLKQVGITRSKHGLYAAPSPEDLATIRKSYEVWLSMESPKETER